MSDVVLTVRGEAERRVPPQRAVVRASVRADGPERGPVIERVTTLTEPVRDGLIAHQRSGEVAEFASDRVSVWSERPWNQDGRQLPLVHHAAIEVTATFTDFGALSWWIGDVADTAELSIDGIEWMLHPEHRVEVEREVAAEAVRTAVVRAEAYAAAIGLAEVRPTQIADLGLLDGSRPSEPAPKMMRAMAMESGAPGVALQPADIVVTAAVEARFTAV